MQPDNTVAATSMAPAGSIRFAVNLALLIAPSLICAVPCRAFALKGGDNKAHGRCAPVSHDGRPHATAAKTCQQASKPAERLQLVQGGRVARRNIGEFRVLTDIAGETPRAGTFGAGSAGEDDTDALHLIQRERTFG